MGSHQDRQFQGEPTPILLNGTRWGGGHTPGSISQKRSNRKEDPHIPNPDQGDSGTSPGGRNRIGSLWFIVPHNVNGRLSFYLYINANVFL